MILNAVVSVVCLFSLGLFLVTRERATRFMFRGYEYTAFKRKANQYRESYAGRRHVVICAFAGTIALSCFLVLCLR